MGGDEFQQAGRRQSVRHEVRERPPYGRMNRIQAVAKGTFTATDTLVYEMYELR